MSSAIIASDTATLEAAGTSRHIRCTCREGLRTFSAVLTAVEASWNATAHSQKPVFVFRRNGRVHLNRPGGVSSVDCWQPSCAPSAVVTLDKPCSEVVWKVLATHCIRQFPLHFPSLRHRVASHFNWSLIISITVLCSGRGPRVSRHTHLTKSTLQNIREEQIFHPSFLIFRGQAVHRVTLEDGTRQVVPKRR